jgi:hypothetical protein
VKVPSKIPVYITYFTTYIDNGQLYFGNDLYSRDDKLVPIFMSGAMPSTLDNSFFWRTAPPDPAWSVYLSVLAS